MLLIKKKLLSGNHEKKKCGLSAGCAGIGGGGSPMGGGGRERTAILERPGPCAE